MGKHNSVRQARAIDCLVAWTLWDQMEIMCKLTKKRNHPRYKPFAEQCLTTGSGGSFGHLFCIAHHHWSFRRTSFAMALPAWTRLWMRSTSKFISTWTARGWLHAFL